MDRQGWIAVILCIAGLILWQWYYVENYSAPPAPAAQKSSSGDPAASPVVEAAPATSPIPGSAPRPASTPVGPTISAATERMVTEKAEYVFSNDAGGIERAILLMHLGEQQEAIFLNGNRAMPIGAIGFAPGEISGGFAMEKDNATHDVVFSRTDSDGLRITKRFDPLEQDASNPYLVRLTIDFENTGSEPLRREGYFVSVGGAAPVHTHDLPTYTKFDWAPGGSMTGIDVNWFNAGGLPLLGIQWSGPKTLFSESRPDVQWAGVASQYFCTVITPEKTTGTAAWASRFDTKKLNDMPVFGIQGALGMPPIELAPGGRQSQVFTIYTGPKDLTLLRSLGGTQDRVLNFGMFGWISEILLWAMNSLRGVLGSYALAIIVLTLIIKSLLWPVQNKATNEMRKMAALSPKMTELREKYKDDPQKLNEEMMKMYREYGVNPFSGCLPMLIQIPIFFGFYAMLGSAIELRNSSFLWVSDLSQPDTIGHVLGFPINLLPIVMAGTMVWQMIITPKSGDAMQQRIFYFMPIIFLGFCYNYASALALYWTTQNIFSIVQLYLTRNRPLPELEKRSVIAKREAAAVKKKKRAKP
ncbi:MAG: membrane protein insertase YidC [Terrimicrobiaceae bacterium]